VIAGAYSGQRSKSEQMRNAEGMGSEQSRLEGNAVAVAAQESCKTGSRRMSSSRRQRAQAASIAHHARLPSVTLTAMNKGLFNPAATLKVRAGWVAATAAASTSAVIAKADHRLSAVCSNKETARIRRLPNHAGKPVGPRRLFA